MAQARHALTASVPWHGGPRWRRPGWPNLEKRYQAYVAWGQHRALPDGDDMTLAFDELVRDRFILGDPSECVEQIQRCVAATGATTMVFRVHWPGMPHELVGGRR